MRRHWYRRCAAEATLDRRSEGRAQHFLDLPGELLLAVWLGQKLHVGLELALAHERTLEISPGEQHLEAGTYFHRLGLERAAGRFTGHDDVGKQQLDLLVMPQHVERLRAVRSRNHAVAEADQLDHGNRQNTLVI